MNIRTCGWSMLMAENLPRSRYIATSGKDVLSYLHSRGVVVNAMLRWLYFKGRGLVQGDVTVVTNAQCFADDR